MESAGGGERVAAVAESTSGALMWRVGPVPSMPAGQLRERSIKHDRAVTMVGRVAMYTPPNVIAFTWAEHDWLAVRNVSGQLVEAASAPSPRCELHREHHGWLAPLTDCREPLRQARSNGWRKHLNKLAVLPTATHESNSGNMEETDIIDVTDKKRSPWLYLSNSCQPPFPCSSYCSRS